MNGAIRKQELDDGPWFSRDGRGYPGGDRVDLLEHIADSGSVWQAARRMGMSYKAARETVAAMNGLAGRPLVTHSPDGRGGRASLTDDGHRLVAGYRLIADEYRRLLARMETEFGDFDQIHRLLRAIAMKTSARNQFRGRIDRLDKGTINTEVHMDLGDGLGVFAIVTNDAVDELGLVAGKEAVALVKSSFIILSTDQHFRISARNQLPGEVIEIIQGAVSTEVKVKLPGDRILTAIVTDEAQEDMELSLGSRVCALVKSSHVILAVND